jgi:hypothetical protein
VEEGKMKVGREVRRQGGCHPLFNRAILYGSVCYGNQLLVKTMETVIKPTGF